MCRVDSKCDSNPVFLTPIEVDHEISRDHSASSTTTRTSTSASRVVLRMSRATPRATKISRRGCKTKNITKWTIKGATVQCHAKGNSVLEAGVYIKSKITPWGNPNAHNISFAEREEDDRFKFCLWYKPHIKPTSTATPFSSYHCRALA